LAKFLVLTSFGMLAGNIWIWLRSLFGEGRGRPAAAEIAAAAEIPPGGVKLFAYPTPQDPCIMVRKPDGALVAYAQKCTHLSCAVYYSARENRLECPCHEGYFSVHTGRVLQGPPPRPLPRVRLEQRGDRIYATGFYPAPEGD
jgi:Rieske Fe-S protein